MLVSNVKKRVEGGHNSCGLLRISELLLKPGQNKRGQKIFQLQHFLNTFSQLAAEKKYSKNGAARKFFSPSYFDPALNNLLTDGQFIPQTLLY